MNRLPCCDRTTHQSELAVFASLGLAGVIMVALALAQMSQFVAGSDRMTAALTVRRAPLATATPVEIRLNGATNLSGRADAPAATRGLANGKPGAARDSGWSLLLR
jgi:hypothetical protein